MMDSLKQQLQLSNQEHVLQHNNHLSETEKKELYGQLSSCDIVKVTDAFHKTMKAAEQLGNLAQNMEPLHSKQISGVNSSDSDFVRKCYEKGLELIGKSKVAVLLMAGGQGTRLGSTNPKGIYPLDLISKRTLFDIQALQIKKLQQLAGDTGFIMWYVMCSDATYEATMQYFADKQHFGLDPTHIVFFKQHVLPAFNFQGKLIMKNTHSLNMSPAGNGAIYEALVRERLLDDMRSVGIEYVHIYGVDNCLALVADPSFIGYTHLGGFELAAKAVGKRDPHESVGVFAIVNGKYHVVEYSEIDRKTAESVDSETGRLKFWAGNIANYCFKFEFLENVCNNGLDSLPYHIAKKKIPFLSDDGSTVVPQEPNGIKLELFMFDIMSQTKSFGVWEVKREDEFEPLKNADSATSDNPTSCRSAYYRRSVKWLRSAGYKCLPSGFGTANGQCPNGNGVAGDHGLRSGPDCSGKAAYADEEGAALYGNGQNELAIEVSPLLSYNGEGLSLDKNFGIDGTIQSPAFLE